MQDKSFQDEVPRERINIKFVKQVGNAKQDVELPLKLLMLGDYTLREGGPELRERKRVSVNKQNFQDVMKTMGLKVNLTVPNRLVDEEGQETPVSLKFDNLDAFRPESVAQQVPQLRSILAVRNLLTELRAHVITNREFRRALEEIVRTDLDGALTDLDQLAPMPDALSRSE